MTQIGERNISPFPFTDLPLETVVRVLEFSTGTTDGYRSLCLVSRSTRQVVLEYAISALIIPIGGIHHSWCLLQFLRLHPQVAGRLRHLRVQRYFDYDFDVSLHTQNLRSILQCCPNLYTLSITATFLRDTINTFPTFDHLQLTTLHLDCDASYISGTSDIYQHPHTRALLRQVTHMICEVRHPASFLFMLPKPGTTGFENLSHFVYKCDVLDNLKPAILQILHTIQPMFPVLTQIMFSVPNHGPEQGSAARERRYKALALTKEWDMLYLVFEPLPVSWKWIDMGDTFWDRGVRLVTSGDDKLIEPPEWPDFDVFSYRENILTGQT